MTYWVAGGEACIAAVWNFNICAAADLSAWRCCAWTSESIGAAVPLA
jgi:hypothetical protein